MTKIVKFKGKINRNTKKIRKIKIMDYQHQKFTNGHSQHQIKSSNKTNKAVNSPMPHKKWIVTKTNKPNRRNSLYRI